MKLHRSTQRGFSMIEVLIAIVVLAIGLLGFALLQTTNLRYTQSANNRTMATNLAYSLLDQMRSNRLSAAQYTSAGFATAACTAPAGNDAVSQGIANWRCQVLNALGPSAQATVTYDASGEATVTLSWGERSAIASEDTTEFTARTQL
ncbi:Type IV pilus modification protein PilV [Luteimonas sp. 9C]|uniref:type IV pilus modification protein PilV n=1 Tax=Luteimonas sp. 9C TaxID=2653148 RepID=UPI0012F30AC9|nr:type IV pilus modification protein PilV [Luteimonas sp. 9C]VXB45232.1 Type IV pilus modification protein PilV [Luteimonas sp. 9C]